MDIEVIHNKDDFFRVRFDLIHKAPDLFRPIHRGSGFLHRMDNPPGVGLDEAEHADCSIAYIFRIYLRGISGTHRQRLPAVAKNLVRLFIHAPDRVARLRPSSRMTALSRVRSVTVQRAYPSGGAVHALAMIFASTSPVAFRRAVSEFGFLAGAIAAWSPCP